jgi:hypothetical protein
MLCTHSINTVYTYSIKLFAKLVNSKRYVFSKMSKFDFQA